MADEIFPWEKGPASPPLETQAPSGEAFPWEKAATPAAPKPTGDMTWTDVGLNAVKNIPSSAVKFGHDLIQPIIHPIDTAKAIGNVGQGALQKLGVMEGDEYTKHADAVGEFFKNRYGSLEAAKRSLADDPVGVASDLSMILTGGGSLAARAPGILGKTGEAVRAAGTAIDPVSAAVGAVKYPAKLAGNIAAETIGGIGTHTGAESLKVAAHSGFEGGQAAQAFRENMRGTAPMEDAVIAAREGLENIRRERGKTYRDQMITHIANDPTILSMADIGDALTRMNKVNTYKGQSLSPSTSAVRKTLEDEIYNWARLPSHEFHTVEGLDALKRKVGDIMDGTKPGTPDRKVVGEVYNSIKNTITTQAPEYARIMHGYEKASGLVKELESTLSLNPKASIDTTLRKLQSTLRDNVNTSFGRRKELAQYLVDAGAPHLIERLAGQAMKPWTARGLGKMQLGAEVAALIGLATVNPVAAAKAATLLPAMSPRIMGEAAHLAGRAGRYGSKVQVPKSVRDLLYQTGRTSGVEQ